MAYSFELDKVNFNMLKESGEYEKNFIEALEQENFEYLERTDVKELCKNKEFVEPLLYACINSKKVEMYEIYAHLEDEVQYQLLNDYNLSCNILQTAPEVIKDTPLAEDEKAILNNVNNRPEIVRYISNDLMDNPTFVSELAQKDPAVVKEIVENHTIDELIAANPSLMNNPTFVMEAINKDRTAVVGFILENKEKLGISEIDVVRDAVKDNTAKDYMKIIDENAEKSTDERFKKVQNKVAEHGENNPLRIRWITAMAAQAEKVEPEMISEVVDYLTMTRLRLEKVMQAEPEHEISKEEVFELIKPQILNRLIDKSQIKEMEPGMEQKIEEYNKFYEEFHGKFVQQKQARIEQEKQETQENQNYNNEIHVAAIEIAKDGNVEGRVAMNNVLEPVPEFVNKGIEEHGFPSNTIDKAGISRNTRNIATLQKSSDKEIVK